MTDLSANLSLAFLAPAQAQKHVTVNEALLRLDALVQLSVVSATITAQPGSPTDGSVYILPAGKTGASWGAMANGALAYWRDGAWEAVAPREGWIAWVKDTDKIVAHDGAAWAHAVPLSTAANAWSRPQTAAAPVTGPQWLIDGPTGGAGRYFEWRTNGSPRWRLIGATYDAETGANAGSDFVIQALNDAGGFLANPIMISRATGVARFAYPPTVGSDVVYYAGAAPIPNNDGVQNIGSASFRFATVFASTGTINTSDAREKTPLAPIPESVKRAVRRVIAQIGVFQWLEAVERKGPDRARLHVGVTAQAVHDAFIAEGEDPTRWGLFCEDAVMERVEIEPARIERVTIQDPETGAEEIIETPVPARFEQRPKQDAEGAPVTRLGVRADQLMWLALAAAA